MMRLSFVVTLATLIALTSATLASAQFKAQPFEFVGTAAQCAPSPAGVDTIDAGWVAHEGLPDAGNSNHALLLQKLGATSNCAAPGATITGVGGLTLSELGYDSRNDGHCGAGAPRFNVVMSNDGLHFIGCAAGPVSGGPLTDPQGKTWTRKRWSPADLANPVITFPPITAASGTVVSIDIIFDEGDDTGPDFTGTSHLDNIDINKVLIGKPGLAK
jgi:hypothetical protein